MAGARPQSRTLLFRRCVLTVRRHMASAVLAGQVGSRVRPVMKPSNDTENDTAAQAGRTVGGNGLRLRGDRKSGRLRSAGKGSAATLPGKLAAASTNQTSAGWRGRPRRPSHPPASQRVPRSPASRRPPPRGSIIPVRSTGVNAPFDPLCWATSCLDGTARSMGSPSAEDESNRDYSTHAQAIPSAPGAATATLATHAVCLRAHRFGPGRLGGLGRPGTPRPRTTHVGPARRVVHVPH